jgi:outer membrane protein assembly factor BamD (BamD/ComL family)
LETGNCEIFFAFLTQIPKRTKRDLITLEEKEICLNNAKLYFNRLLKEFPESEWALAAGDKIRKIDEAVKSLH